MKDESGNTKRVSNSRVDRDEISSISDAEGRIATLEQTDEPAGREVPPHLKKLAYILDNSIVLPGGFRIGWDGLIGLIPGIGDLAGLALSTYIVVAAARLGVGRATLARMCFYVALEAAIGVIPLVGDVFDMGFKANSRNLKLIEAYLTAPDEVRRSSGFLFFLVMLFVGLMMLFALWAIVFVTMAVISLLG